MRARDFLPRSFLDLPRDDDEAVIGRGQNLPLGIHLGASVGRRRPNAPADVATVETLLRQTGNLDFRPEHTAAGLFSAPLDRATRSFQRRNRLVDDGVDNPDGETFRTLTREIA